MILNKIKKNLETQKNDIITKVRLMNQDKEIDASGDEVDLIQARIIALAAEKLAERDQKKLKQIEIALKKIADGNFGDCEECGEPIADKRLLHSPYFSSCISCAEAIEIKAKRQLQYRK